MCCSDLVISMYKDVFKMVLEQGVCYDKVVGDTEVNQIFPSFILRSQAKFSTSAVCCFFTNFVVEVSHDNSNVPTWNTVQSALKTVVEVIHLVFCGKTGWSIALDDTDILWSSLNS